MASSIALVSAVLVDSQTWENFLAFQSNGDALIPSDRKITLPSTHLTFPSMDLNDASNIAIILRSSDLQILLNVTIESPSFAFLIILMSFFMSTTVAFFAFILNNSVSQFRPGPFAQTLYSGH